MIEGMKRVLGVISRDEIKEIVSQEFRDIRRQEKYDIRKMIGEAVENLLAGRVS